MRQVHTPLKRAIAGALLAAACAIAGTSRRCLRPIWRHSIRASWR